MILDCKSLKNCKVTHLQTIKLCRGVNDLHKVIAGSLLHGQVSSFMVSLWFNFHVNIIFSSGVKTSFVCKDKDVFKTLLNI